MKFFTILLATYILFSFQVLAKPITQTPPRQISFDFAMPYLFSVDGDSFNKADHLNAGLHLQHFISNNIAFGSRFSVDIQEDAGRVRRWVVAPGIMYQWFQGQTWMPYLRADIPITVRGALNNSGSSKKMDAGFIGAFGLAWNIGNQMGLDNMLLSYDFSFRYFFGFGDAVANFGIEFARFGLQYRF